MKGLLYKDLMILRQQGKSFLIIMLCGFFMAFEFEPEFVISYMAVIAAFAVLGTIGYDEFDHGYSFLFTLPVFRKTYVREKYLLTFLAVLCVSVISFTGIAIIETLILHKPLNLIDMAEGSLVMMGVALMMSALSIPLRIKYGSEKSRIAQFIIYGVVLVAVLGTRGIADLLKIDFSGIASLNADVAAPVILMIMALLFGVSEKICEGIISKKEY